ALDTPRPGQRADETKNPACAQFDRRDSRLGVGGDEAEGYPSGERVRCEPKRDGKGRGGDEELAALHGRDTGSAGREVPARKDALDLVGQRALRIDELDRDRA